MYLNLDLLYIVKKYRKPYSLPRFMTPKTIFATEVITLELITSNFGEKRNKFENK